MSSFRSIAPIAQEALSRDLAEWSDDDESIDNMPGDDIEELGGEAGPTLYQRPSGIADGVTRPFIGLAPPLEEPILTPLERHISRDAERSLLRDNHILPPKHPVVKEPGFLQRAYKSVFSTKVPIPGPDEENQPQVTETSALLGSAGPPQAPAAGEEHLNEQWREAVAAGQIRTTWQREAKTILGYSSSLVIQQVLQYSLGVTSIFAVSHIGKVELGAVSLAYMTANITCYAPVQGLATSLDTLCAQAYGSGHKHLVGLQLQRVTYFLLLLLLPITVLFLNAEPILAALIPERESARFAAIYLRVILLGTPAMVCFECGKRFVQAQGLFHATRNVLLIAAPVNVVLNWYFVWHLGFGFVGAPIAVVITQNLQPVLLLLYVIFVDGSQCWGGFSKRALSNWGPMIRLAIPGMIMLEAEWLAFEILTLAAGQFGTSHLAAQSILVTLTGLTFQLPFPLSIAGSTRIANLVGAKLVDAARISAKVTYVAGIAVGILNFVIVLSLRYQIPLLFTQDEEVIAIVAAATPVCAVMQIWDGAAAVSHGVLRGIGRQEFGGYVNLAIYYLVALPISFGTAFGLGWKLDGLWAGVTVGLFLVTIIESTYSYYSDWHRAAYDAERRNASG